MKWIILWIVLAGGDSPDAVPHEQDKQVAKPTANAISKRNRAAKKKPAASKAADERSITDIRRDVRNGLRAEAVAKDATTAQHDAIGALIELHREIVRHSTFESGFALRESRSQLQSRLVRIERGIRKRFDAPRAAKATGKKTGPARVDDRPALAQQIVPVGPGGPNQRGGAGGAGVGAGQPGVAGQGIGGQLPDFGPDLADLIQQVIDPDFWDVNGGPGSIVYFQPLKALVISATAEVHQNLAGVMGQLRAAP